MGLSLWRTVPFNFCKCDFTGLSDGAVGIIQISFEDLDRGLCRNCTHGFSSLEHLSYFREWHDRTHLVPNHGVFIYVRQHLLQDG